jgi:secreted PhoX family phosphatase
MNEIDRRHFVKFLAGGVVTLSSCGSSLSSKSLPFKPLSFSHADELILAEGLSYNILIKQGDQINRRGDIFGHNNDYTAFIPVSKNEAFFWVNHEYPLPQFIHGRDLKAEEKTKEMIDKEREVVGGSILRIKRDNENSPWQVDKTSTFNKRLTGKTKIPFVANRAIAGKKNAVGTFGNCAGGVTPWGTVLTCEENYHDYYGEINFGSEKRIPSRLGWERHYKNSPHHYGWVVEVDLKTGASKKLTGIGRYAHECATCIRTKDGRVAVYSGDDKAGEFLYKFISKNKNNLHEGELFVADIKKGKWLSLDINKSKILKDTFKDQLDVLIHCRKAGRLLGATHLDRPEDIEIHPETGDVFVTLTNNKKRGNFHGSILRLKENNRDYLSRDFKAEDFLVGGDDFSCPDNLAFDRKGNLWMVSDISGSAMGKGPYKKFKNNGLFYIPMSGANSGRVFQVASAPIDAELTGLSFSADYKTLFMSVQHPGEKSKGPKDLTSHWPDGGNSIPLSSVVQISGKVLESLQA